MSRAIKLLFRSKLLISIKGNIVSKTFFIFKCALKYQIQFGSNVLSKKSNETMPSHNMADLLRCFISNWDILFFFFSAKTKQRKLMTTIYHSPDSWFNSKCFKLGKFSLSLAVTPEKSLLGRGAIPTATSSSWSTVYIYSWGWQW